MLLSASPHPNTHQCSEAYSALPATFTENSLTSVPDGPLPLTQPSTSGLTTTSLTSTRAPANSLHTPQQLAQLDALARAQARDKAESTLVSEDEKALYTQLAYLASQHQASEYNRQKPALSGAPTPGVYIPLSIQLPNHILELRARQKEASLRQAWFIAPPRDDESNYEGQPDQIQPDDEIGGLGRERDGATSEAGLRDLESSRSYEQLSYLYPATIEVELLQDALGNSVFPVSQSAFKVQSTKFPPTALPPLPTQPILRALSTTLDPDVVETPPPLGETILPQFPSPARSRAPSQSLLVRPANVLDTLPAPHLGDLPVVSELPKDLHLTTNANTLLVPDERPTLWPPPPVRPAAVHVAPPPSPQLQLALETAISKDKIVDQSWLSWAQGGVVSPLGVSDVPAMQTHGIFGPPSPASGSPSLSMRPPIFIPPPPTPKTSETHPINISQVIPSEYIHAISSHLETYPTTEDETQLEAIVSRGSYFRIDPYFRLDRIIHKLAVRAIEARAAMAKYSPAPVRVKFAEDISSAGPALFMGPGVRTSVSEPNFDRPLKRPLAMTSPTTLMTPSAKRMEPSPIGPPRMQDQFVPNMLNLDLRGNDVSPLDTRHLDPSLSAAPHYPAAWNGNPAIREPEQPNASPRATITLPALPPLSRAMSGPPSAVSLHSPLPPSQSLPNLHSSSPGGGTPTPSNGDFVLGNLYLSSCPGKKVRLNGPIRGRGAICRNLSADLARVKSTGVHLVICCLDDDEMEFLGAPWPEYKETAAAVGLDVLRLPMPEGLCPLSVRAMSQHMDRIIYNYTLNGRHVLVHCRGGVGRAGLVACTWMLKLGICGSVEPTSKFTIQDPSAQSPAEALMQDKKVPRDSMELLERVVHVIRRQRSVKAIETYEQVRFLLEFIEYLRDTDAKTLEALS